MAGFDFLFYLNAERMRVPSSAVPMCSDDKLQAMYVNFVELAE